MKRPRASTFEDEGEIDLERNGERYVGRFQTKRGMVTVFYGFHQKTTHIGNSPVRAIARMLLIELV